MFTFLKLGFYDYSLLQIQRVAQIGDLPVAETQGKLGYANGSMVFWVVISEASCMVIDNIDAIVGQNDIIAVIVSTHRKSLLAFNTNVDEQRLAEQNALSVITIGGQLI